MGRYLAVGFALLLMTGAAAAQDQKPFSIELRGGAVLPAEDFGDASLKTGGGFELTGAFALAPVVRAYAAWDWHRLSTDTPFEGGNFDINNIGYTLGLQLDMTGPGSASAWLRAGPVYNHIELYDKNAGRLVYDSGYGFGWEIGSGLRIPVGGVALTPGVRYRTYSSNLSAGRVVPVELSFVAAELGISWSFGERGVTAVARQAQ